MKFPTEQSGVQPIIDYLGHHPMRPKEEIARALAELGFKIPYIFDDFDSAVRSGEKFIARSEGPDELFHSGLKVSITNDGNHEHHARTAALAAAVADPSRSYHTLTADGNPMRDLVRRSDGWARIIKNVTGVDYDRDELARAHGFSYWKVADGNVMYIIADSGREGRYYIGGSKSNPFFAEIEDGTIKNSWEFSRDVTLPDARKMTEFYEAVVQAGPFDSENAAFLECVDPGPTKEIAFLQYLPTHKRTLRKEKIDVPQNGITWVRGATTVDQPAIAFTDGDHLLSDIKNGRTVIPIAGKNFLASEPVSGEFILPRAAGMVIGHYDGEILKRYGGASINHGSRGTMFKPKVTIGLSSAALDFYHEVEEYNKPRRTLMKVDSDGERAQVLVKRGKKVVSLHDTASV
ncbi:hypothetical protein KBD87_00840 [Candidatus Saccharibacteria bacterium]|nr:hypothetical protein [Candidatus Saccharibacteria bacterium]